MNSQIFIQERIRDSIIQELKQDEFSLENFVNEVNYNKIIVK